MSSNNESRSTDPSTLESCSLDVTKIFVQPKWFNDEAAEAWKKDRVSHVDNLHARVKITIRLLSNGEETCLAWDFALADGGDERGWSSFTFVPVDGYQPKLKEKYGRYDDPRDTLVEALEQLASELKINAVLLSGIGVHARSYFGHQSGKSIPQWDAGYDFVDEEDVVFNPYESPEDDEYRDAWIEKDRDAWIERFDSAMDRLLIVHVVNGQGSLEAVPEDAEEFEAAVGACLGNCDEFGLYAYAPAED